MGFIGGLFDSNEGELRKLRKIATRVNQLEADVQKKFDEDKKVLPQMAGMTPEQYDQQIREVFGWDHYVEFQKLQLEFEHILMPDPPADISTSAASNKRSASHSRAMASTRSINACA